MLGRMGIVSWLMAAGAMAPFACEDERSRPADTLERNDGEGEGEAEPVSPFACGEDRYECRGNSECVDGVCRTPEDQEEKWCKSIVFVERAKHVFIPIDKFIGENDEEGNFRGTCLRSDFFDFKTLETASGAQRPFLWGAYEGDNALELMLDKATTIDQREGKTFAELKDSDYYGRGMCEENPGFFFDVHEIPGGLYVPWIRTTLSVLHIIDEKPTDFFVLRAAFYATESGEAENVTLGTKIDDNQGGPIVITDFLDEEGPAAGMDAATTGEISPSCEFLEIGAYHTRISPHYIRELRVYLQPLKPLGLSALEVWSCHCDEFPEGSIWRKDNEDL